MNKLSEEEFLEMQNDIREHFQAELKKMSNYTNFLKHLKSIKENESSLYIDLFQTTVRKEVEYQKQIFETLEKIKINKNFPKKQLFSIYLDIYLNLKKKDNFEFIRNVSTVLNIDFNNFPPSEM